MATRNAVLPTLFGRATIVHGEHANLAGIVEQLRASCSSPEDSSALEGTFLVLFENFSEQLCLHFASEESPDYFGAVVAECPWLDDGVAELRRDHERMTGALRALELLSRDASQREFTARLVELMDGLGAHEKRERSLLQEFFGRSDAD